MEEKLKSLKTPELENLWSNNDKDSMEIRLAWSNNRYHGVSIEPPFIKNKVIRALEDLCCLISRDYHLD